MGTWNGTAFLTTGDLAPTAEFTSDASGSWGCGAWHGHQWLQTPWDSKAQALDISCKELIPIILASATWGHKWARHQVVCHCDNQVVVAALRSCSSRQPHLMHLLKCVAFAEASLNFNMSATYISSKSNHLADDSSTLTIPHILHDIQHLHALPCIRAVPLRLLSAPGRPRHGSPDRQHLSGGSAQHVTLAWPARPK